MPYIITTRPPSEPHQYSAFKEAQADGRVGPLTRIAVATLEEAREAAAAVAGTAYSDEWIMAHANRGTVAPLIDAAWDLPEAGGTIGPLPDGTVIEVQAVCWNWIIGMADDAGIDTDAVYEDGGDLAILAAYNGAQS